MPNIVAENVTVAVTSQGLVGTTAYRLRVFDTRIELHYGEFQFGLVRFTTSGGSVGVETINVNALRRGRGLGKLLLAALCAYAQQHGFQNIRLNTEDTSGGFWAQYGVGQGGNTGIAAVMAQIWAADSITIT